MGLRTYVLVAEKVGISKVLEIHLSIVALAIQWVVGSNTVKA
jgi:hypothetical protein